MIYFDGQYNTPHHTFPFDKNISVDNIRHEILRGMEEQKAEINAIISQAETPTFENTIVKLEHSGALLDRATTLLYTLIGLDTNDGLDELANEMSPLLSAHELAIMHNQTLLERVVAVYKEYVDKPMDDEDRMLLKRPTKVLSVAAPC